MICTIQLHSLSGSFSSPWGKDVFTGTLGGCYELFRDWADKHDQLGADPTDAHALLWKGRIPDVQDLYPDWELTMGPRGGIRRSLC